MIQFCGCFKKRGAYLTKAAVAAATAYLANVAYCETLWNYYKNFECRRCKGCWSREELFAMAIICLNEARGRLDYLTHGCDYILPGSIREGSAEKARKHKIQLISKMEAAGRCLELASRAIK